MRFELQGPQIISLIAINWATLILDIAAQIFEQEKDEYDEGCTNKFFNVYGHAKI
jgi:hypothetical protein